ncbi:cilia- and flagella-associated protein 74 [Ahaetulla prasina]|uniref:cilia- and flagella-associated protein 74 n=1 Tax=Ahaetulla prasina TaxID=499056 RepID=UPI00264764CF|nr:cilia- and flagella-associated protein 74 [Ahaetulla prasina]
MEFHNILEEDLSPDLYPIVEGSKEEETNIFEEFEQDMEGHEEGEEAEGHPAEEVSLEETEEATDISKKSSEGFPVPSRGRTMNYTDRVRVLNLRRNLNQLDSLTKEKELLIQKTREELATCHARLDMLIGQQKDVEKEIEKEKKDGNTAAVSRLQALHRRLCTELGNEKSLECKITAALNENVFEMWKIEIEQGNFAKLRKQLKLDEAELDQQRRDQAEERLQKQNELSQLLSQRWQNTERKIQEASMAYEENLATVLEDSQRNHAKAVRFLKESLGKVREKESAEEVSHKEHLQKRMETVLSLKNSISSNRENLRTRQVLGKLIGLDAQEQDRKIKEAIQAEGHNVTREFFCQKRQIEFEKRKKEFLDQQKTRKIEIVARILKEEAQVEKIKAQSRPQKSKGPDKLSDAIKWRMKTWRYIEETCSDKVAPVIQKHWRSPSVSPSLDDKSFNASCDFGPESKTEGEQENVDNILAEPEFVGIWDQEYNPLQVLDDKIDSKPLGVSKLEKDIFAQNLEKLHAGVIRKHRVCGREFKGCPFYSKPSLIHFKDFDIGKTYKKKVTLINAFYSINYCKLDGVSEHLKDFFTVLFDPPGPMSSGMSCEVGVTFKPMINEDLEGEVTFLSQTGSFSIPLKCSTKKCVLSLDKELIDFGMHVVGETISRTITLTNDGALGTRFRLRKLGGTEAPGAVPMPSTEKPVSPAAGELSSMEKNSYNTRTDSVSPSHSEEVLPSAAPLEKLHSDATVTTTNEPQAATEMDIAGQISPLSPDVGSLDDPPEEFCELKLGKVTEGDIGPFSSVKLQIIFTPVVPGTVQADFEITFENPDCKPLPIGVIAVSVAVPVWVCNPTIDLKICMYDRLYQDCIVVQSRANSALRLKFEVCKELASYVELLPKTGYIQAHSSFSVQLKFLPRLPLSKDAKKYFDEKTRVLEAPLTIIVSDQSKPVEFSMHAILTTSDLEINPSDVDFGYCSIYEAVRTTVAVTNKAILPQEFGFVGLPKFVEVQPNDGFGVLLPLESLTLDVIFKAKKAKLYSFELVCKTEINREFKLSCKAVGVHPPLVLSHSFVQFPATALDDVSAATLFIINPHERISHFTHTMPRIGEGEIAPVGPTSFQFLVPEDSPIIIIPCVGTVLPGKKCLLDVSFHPALSDQLIRQEAVNITCQNAEIKAQMEKRARELEMQRRKEEAAILGRKDGKKVASFSFVAEPSKDKSPVKPFEEPNPEDISRDSEEYIAAHLNLVRSYTSCFDKYIIPCLVASGDIDEKRRVEDMNFSPYNTLYLELHCPSVAPVVVVTSNNGRTFFNFGDVAVGHRIKKEVEIQNISKEHLVVGYSLLDPFGPFLLANPICSLGEGESRELVLSFCPDESKSYFEILEIRTEKATLTLTLTGRGVIASIACSLEEDVLNMGYVVSKETTTSVFKIENISSLALKYSIVLDSLSPDRYQELQRFPPFLNTPRETHIVGTQNYSGLSVFSVFPMQGVIGVGKSQEFTVTFSPDHESLYYSDRIQILLFDKEIIRVIQLKGAARNHIMYVEGGEPLDVPFESLAVLTSITEEASKAEAEKATNSILVSLKCVQTETLVIPAVRELKVGAIRTAQFASKKNVEFTWESLQILQLKGFSVDPVKGMVERGQTKSIIVSWVPPAGSDPNQPITGSATLIVKGDVKEVYGVYFMGRIVTRETPN